MWPFSDSRTSPRNTTAARGGIAAHSTKKTKRAKAAVEYKGYRIYPSGEGFKTSADRGESEFDTVQDAKRFIADEVKMRRNPSKFDRCVKDVKKKGGAANAYAVCTAAGTRGKKRNPAEQAVKGYVDFHGRQPEEFVTVEQQVHYHRNLAGAGELIELCVLPRMKRGKIDLKNFGGAILAFNEKRNQLFIKGGDQSVDLRVFGIDPREAHERETLGEIESVTYYTQKDHLGSEGGVADYKHKFDKRNRPDLIYRTIEKHLEFSGGSYTILPEGIDR